MWTSMTLISLEEAWLELLLLVLCVSPVAEAGAVDDEKIPFLAYLSSVLKENSLFTYEPPAGSTQFCNLIAGFMKVYHHIPLKND
ncbi:hypothetical protein MKX01_010079, partial [Papaver californicum]